MSKIVIKYGGSNLKSPDGIRRLSDILQCYEAPVLVVSAFYGVTGRLQESLTQILNGQTTVDKVCKDLEETNGIYVRSAIDNQECLSKAEAQCEEILSGLRRLLTAGQCLNEFPDFLRDSILSYGERFSAVIISCALESYGFQSQFINPEEIGLIAHGEYGNATVNFAASEKHVSEALIKSVIYVVPGFYGISSDNKVMLFGRGGTDYAAAGIAACIGAKSLDIWKDVDGFLSCDPLYIPAAKAIGTLNYAEAAELSYFGAKILHPRTVEPLIKACIPIRILNPDSFKGTLEPATIISGDETETKEVIKSISFSDDFGILKLKGPGVGINPGVLSKVSTALHSKGINISSVITSQIVINLLINAQDLYKAVELISELSIPVVSEIVVIDDISLIALVGNGMLEKPGIAVRIFSSVAESGINIKLSSLGASQVVTYLIVDKKDRTNALQQIHNEFFKTNNEKKTLAYENK